MNFSKSCTLKKAMSLIMVIVLVAATFTGCFKKDDDTTEPSTDSGLNLDTSPSSETTEPSSETTEAPTEKTGENMGTVTNVQNVRSIPSMDATVVYQLAVGDRVEIIRQETAAGYNWGLIEEPERGWIVMDYVEMDSGATVPSADPTAPAETTPSSGGNTSSGESVNMKGVITGNGVNIRDDASTSGNRVGSYNKGDVVTILELKNGWGRTNKGWISMDYVNTSDTSTSTTPTTGSNNSSTGGNTGSTGTSNISGNGSTTVIARGIVTAKQLNLRSSASSTENDPIGSLSYGDRVNILEKSGSWGRTSKGWISLNYVYQDGTTGTNTATGTITASQLRIRSGPGTGYDSVGSYNSGDEVKILEQFTYGDTTWGCTNKGWISMDFVDVTEGTSGGLNWEGSGSSNTGSTTSGNTTGTVTANSLYIRSGAGTNYDTVGFLSKGDTVTILATTTVNGVTWGQISSGWISMTYVSTSTSSSSSDSSSMWVD